MMRRWGLVLVVLVAAGLRFWRPGTVEFFHDEALLSLIAQDALVARQVPLLGMPSSVGLPNAPASVHLMMIPYAFSNNPLVATLFIAALNVVGVGLLWAIADRLFGPRVALLAGLIYAVNPWAVLYSRKIWAQNMHTPFILLAIYLGLLGFLDGKRWAQVLCLPVLLFGVQMHYAAWVLLVVYVVLLWTGRREVSVGALLGSAALALLVLAPFAAGLLGHFSEDSGRLSALLDRSDDSIYLTNIPVGLLFNLATGYGLESTMAPDHDLGGVVPPMRGVWIGVLGLGFLGGLVALFRSENRQYAPLLLAWAFLTPLAFIPAWTDVYPHYFIPMIPAFIVFAALGLSLFAGETRWRGVLTFVLLGGVLVTQVVWWGRILNYVDANDIRDGYRTPVRYLLQARDLLADNGDVMILAGGHDVRYDVDAAQWPVMLRDRVDCLRVVADENLVVVPRGETRLFVSPFTDALRFPYTGADVGESPLRDGAYLLRDSVTIPASFASVTVLDNPILFENGVSLTGYQLASDHLWLRWHVPEPEPGADYQFFAHLLDADNERVGQGDGSFLPGRYWCDGDQLFTRVQSDAVDDMRTLRVGMYRLLRGGGFINAEAFDADGQPLGPWVDLPIAN